MRRFRDLGLRKFKGPKERFDELVADAWGQRSLTLFSGNRERALEILRAAHERFLAEEPARIAVDHIPEDHLLRHIEFNLRSFGFGFNPRIDVSDDVREMREGYRGRTIENPYANRSKANILHSTEVVIAFLEEQNGSTETNYRFFERLIEAGVLKDPLFLAYMLDRANARDLSGIDSEAKLICFLDLLLRRWSTQAEMHPDTADALPFHTVSNEDKLAGEFAQCPRPFDLGGKFVVYAADGQIGERIWALPENVTRSSANAMASILMYGIVPGGVVGGHINHHQIHLGLDRADIDLLTVYDDRQAVVIVPFVQGIERSGYPYTRKANAKVMYRGNKKTATEIMLGVNDGWLPHVPSENLAIAISVQLLDEFKGALSGLATKLGATDLAGYCKRVISYDPAHWGNVHNFVEFLQVNQEGMAVLERALEK